MHLGKPQAGSHCLCAAICPAWARAQFVLSGALLTHLLPAGLGLRNAMHLHQAAWRSCAHMIHMANRQPVPESSTPIAQCHVKQACLCLMLCQGVQELGRR
jgi:hypothetical protein